MTRVIFPRIYVLGSRSPWLLVRLFRLQCNFFSTMVHFRTLLFTPDWQELIFRHGLLRPGIEADSWDECIRYLAGGTAKEKPLYWTTSDSASQKIFEAWQKEGPNTAFEVFQSSLEEIVHAVDVFKEFAPVESEMVVRLDRPPDYRQLINGALSDLSENVTKSPEWESVN